MPAPLVRSYEEAAVVIAGGTSGVGLASAHAFAAAGVRRIALLARTPERGEAARRQVLQRCPEAQVEFVPLDATDPDRVQAAVAEAHAALGTIDVMVSSVTGHYRPELLHRTPYDDIAGILMTMALPPMLLTRAVLPIMAEQGGGSIVTIASDAAKVATPGESVLAARWRRS
jgi:2-hydroxycyclohexanecarboxyl-CoA dehydrogenase